MIHSIQLNPTARPPASLSGIYEPALPELLEDQANITLTSTSGQQLEAEVGFRLHGPPGAPLVVALGGISASRNIQRWWPELYGASCGLDPQQFRILGLDWFGRCWPNGQCVTTDEQGRLLAGVLDHLGIARVRLLVGASYGAMVGLAFAARYRDRLDELLAISGADQAHPMAMARRRIQRAIVHLGETAGCKEEGLVLARALALTTYRPLELFEQRFADSNPQQVGAAISDYFDYQGRKFLESFNGERYCCLSESLDLHRVVPESIECPVTLVGVDSDELVPFAQLEKLADRLGGKCRLSLIKSHFGHDAFLKEPEIVNDLICGILSGESGHACN